MHVHAINNLGTVLEAADYLKELVQKEGNRLRKKERQDVCEIFANNKMSFPKHEGWHL